MRVALAFVLVTAGGCLKGGGFQCASDAACVHDGTQGTCEPVGYCSFPDTACTSGRRFGGLAGSVANRCVGEPGPDGGPVDAGGDAPPADAAPNDGADGAMASCPPGYAALAGAPGHLYRRLPVASWTAQRDACHADGPNVYLAIPDDDAELVAVHALAAANFWIGIDDLAAEGTFVTVRGATPSYLPWAPGQPDNTGNSDCVEALGSLRFDDKKCTATAIAVCECEP